MNLSDARDLAFRLMDRYGLLEKGWRFGFDSAYRRAGCMSRRRRRIWLSAPLTFLNSQHIVKNTILHEIAHALVRTKIFHGAKWRSKAVEIGWKSSGPHARTELPGVKRIPYRFHLTCVFCETYYTRDRRSKRKTYCSKCVRRTGKKRARYILQWVRNPAFDVFTKAFREARRRHERAA